MSTLPWRESAVALLPSSTKTPVVSSPETRSAGSVVVVGGQRGGCGHHRGRGRRPVRRRSRNGGVRCGRGCNRGSRVRVVRGGLLPHEPGADGEDSNHGGDRDPDQEWPLARCGGGRLGRVSGAGRPVPGAVEAVDREAESRRLLCRHHEGRTGVRQVSRTPCKTPHRPGSTHHIGCRTPRSSILVGVHPTSVTGCPTPRQPGWCGARRWSEHQTLELASLVRPFEPKCPGDRISVEDAELQGLVGRPSVVVVAEEEGPG